MAQQAPGQTDSHQESHGHSLASWVLVGFVLAGTFVVGLAIVLELIWLLIIGLVLCVLGLVAGRLLQMAGFGVHPPAGKTS
jgi:hypothetical protein